MRSILHLLLTFVIIINVASGQTESKKHHTQMPLDCQSCHICDSPTYERPCLKIFPEFTRKRGITVYHSAEEAPEILKIDIISNYYEPTIFTHKLHAEMAGMSGGCVSCHHFNPPGRIAACRECHDPVVTGTDLTKPGLKGAYHRQCLNCHREWSHSNECAVCHALKGDPSAATKIADKASFKEIRHPAITEPAKLVFETEEEDQGPIVTFYHNDHAHRYGLKCVDCHQGESCSRCHDVIKKKPVSNREAHDNCINCHEDEVDNYCQRCHGFQEKSRFDHENTAFPLARYHNSLDCHDCHGKQGTRHAAKPNGDCNNCHKNWDSNSFDHQVTGLVLDENHLNIDCVDCHSNRNFAVPPICDDCHDDVSYPAEKPGEMVNQ